MAGFIFDISLYIPQADVFFHICDKKVSSKSLFPGKPRQNN